MNGQADCVALLLSREPNLLSVTDNRAATALHLAAARGHVDVAELLISHGADGNAMDQVDT